MVNRLKKGLLIAGALVLLAIQFVPILVGALWFHMLLTVEHAKREGVFATPQEGMRVLVERSWIDVERVEIERAGPNNFDGSEPHVWFVTARVWAARRGDWKPVSSRGYDVAGSFFLRVQDGWVHVPEGQFPKIVGLCMRLFGYSG